MQQDSIRTWRRIYDIQQDINQLKNEFSRHSNVITSKLTEESKITNLILARLVAKLDPLYAKSEDDPVRKAASDKLSDEVIAKLRAEHAVRDHCHYTPEKDS
jgi:hypothetical protein